MHVRRPFLVRTLVTVFIVLMTTVMLVRPPTTPDDFGGRQNIVEEYAQRFQDDTSLAEDQAKIAVERAKIAVERAKIADNSATIADNRAKIGEDTGRRVGRSDVVTVMDTKMDGTVENITYHWKDMLDSFEERRSLLQRTCDKYNDLYRPEYQALYSREYTVNTCTATYFDINKNTYSVCNILKGGLNSWKAFFRDNKIEFKYKEDCDDCVGKVKGKIIQVRHPLERLLSAWRHVFEDHGWKGLDINSLLYPEIREELGRNYDKVTWPVFVEHVLLRNTLKRGFNLTTIHSYNEDQNWVLNHWAPIWFTCGVCRTENFPDYILKMETLGRDQSAILNILKVPEHINFPKVKITGSEHTKALHSSKTTQFYYSQITKKQVRELYELYRLDHELFDYDPQKYIDLAQ